MVGRGISRIKFNSNFRKWDLQNKKNLRYEYFIGLKVFIESNARNLNTFAFEFKSRNYGKSCDDRDDDNFSCWIYLFQNYFLTRNNFVNLKFDFSFRTSILTIENLMYSYVDIYLCVFLCSCMQLCIWSYMLVFICSSGYTFICAYINVFICVCVRTIICSCFHIFTCLGVRIHANMPTCSYVHV